MLPPLSSRKNAAYRLRVAVSPLSARWQPPSCPIPDPHRAGSSVASCRFVSARLPTPLPNSGICVANGICNRARKYLIYMSIRSWRGLARDLS